MLANPYVVPTNSDIARRTGATAAHFMMKFWLRMQDAPAIPSISWKHFAYRDLIHLSGIRSGKAKSPKQLKALGVPDTATGGVYAFVIRFPAASAYPDCRYLAYIGKTDRPLLERFKEYSNDDMNPNGTGRLHIWNLIYPFWDRLEFWCADTLPAGYASPKQLEDDLLTRVFPPSNMDYPAGIGGVATSIYRS